MKKLVLVALLLGVALFVGCGGGSSSGGGGNTVNLVGIAITPANPSIGVKATQQFKATGAFSDGSTKDLTTTANWLSSNTAVATINTSGLATAVTAGTSTITASSAGVTGTTTLTVANPLVSIAVTPPSATINPVAPGNTQQFAAIGTFQDGTTQDLTATATWQSTSSTIASVSSPGGLASAVAPGAVTITASLSGVSGTAALTVANPLVSIAVTPANSKVAQLTKPQFTATGTYFDHSSNDITTQVIWSSSNTAAATISNSPGLWGLASAVGPGQTTITATCTPPSPACATGSPVSGSTLLTVSNATIKSIVVTPANAPIALGLQQQYTATATLSDSTTQDVTNIVQWTSSDTTKVTIAVSSGLATGVGITSSPVTITAKAPNGIVGTTTVTVNAGNLQSIALKPTNITTLAQGTSQQFSAIGTFSNGSTLDITNQVLWASSNTTLATVAQKTGLVKAAPSVATPGSVTISATLGSASASVNISITQATPKGVTVTPITATIQPGATQIFHATAQFSDGTFQDVTLDSTWTSSSPSIAVVNFPGRLLGVAQGTATVTATFIGVPGTATLNVTAATLTGITLSPSSANLKPGATVSFQATGTYSDSTTANLTGLATWGTSDPTVATVSNGVALGQGVGPVNITATYQGQTGTAAVVVTSQLLTTIVITPPNPTTYVGVNLPLTATGDPTTQNIGLTASATWASSSSSVATVSNAAGRQGTTTGVGAGTSTITAVFAGITGTTTLTVSPATLSSIAITPLSATIAPGATQQFKAIGTFTDGKTLDLTAQVNWTSSASNVAPINNAGLASGATAGTSTIGASFTQPGQPQPVAAPPATLTVQ